MCALTWCKNYYASYGKNSDEVQHFLDIVSDRAKTIIQIETLELISDITNFKKLNWDYAYIGLNDLMISQHKQSIWESVLDGTVEHICNELKGRAYGFGGITVLGGGKPIPFELILHELVRLNCSLSFLRRSFKREILDRNMELEIIAIKTLITASSMRGSRAREYDHQKLIEEIKKIINHDTRVKLGKLYDKRDFTYVR